MMGPQIVLIDAGALFSVTLRRWILSLYITPESSIFRARYTEDILSTVLTSLRCEHPDWSGQKILDIRRLIERVLEGGLVEEYDIDPAFPGHNVSDAHIHSAAVACGAHIILTDIGQDLLPPEIDPNTLPYEVWTPDEFLVLIDDSAPDLVHEVTAQQLTHCLKESQEADLAGDLRRAGAPNFALRVANHLRD
ncbi:PIN domain-containing protein [Kocuria sp. CPCC 205231]|uniref:PIN domain-containing protein n=1 Tax=unclassified Kocuria TaxID=2649579 RepID=UPI001E31BB87